MLSLTPSDALLIAAALPALAFALIYGIGSPWYKAPLGWAIFLYSLAVLALLFLIGWGIFTGDRIGEGWRTAIAGFLFLAAWAKVIMLIIERRGPRPRNRKD